MENPQLLELLLILLVVACFGRLNLDRAQLLFNFLNDVVHPQQVLLCPFQFAEGLFFLGLVLANAGGFFKNQVPFNRVGLQQDVDFPLLDIE